MYIHNIVLVISLAALSESKGRAPVYTASSSSSSSSSLSESRSSSEGYCPDSPVIYHVDSPVPVFIGRASQLNTTKCLADNGRALVINGVDDIGKRELLKKYLSINCINSKGRYICNIVWLDCTSLCTLIDDSKKFLSSHNIPAKGKDVQKLLGAIVNYFKSCKRRTVFVCADVYPETVFWVQYLNSLIGQLPKFNLLITSGLQNWDPLVYTLTEVEAFNSNEVAEYICGTLINQGVKVTQAQCNAVVDSVKPVPGLLKIFITFIVQLAKC